MEVHTQPVWLHTDNAMPRWVAQIARWQAQLRCRQTCAAFVAAALCLAVAVVYLAVEARHLKKAALERVELHARVIENDANGQFNSLAQSLFLAQEAIAHAPPGQAPAQVGRKLEEIRRSRPVMRSLSLLDAQGTIVATTETYAERLQVRLQDLGAAPPVHLVGLGKWLPVRDLADLAGSPGATAVAPPDTAYAAGSLSLLLRLQRPTGQPWLLLALLDVDALRAQQQHLIGSRAERSALLTFEGQVLHHGRQLPLPPGALDAVRKRLPLTPFFPSRETGTSLGPGLTDPQTLVAYRALRDWPAVVALELAHAEYHGPLRRSAARSGLLLLSAWAGLAAITLFARRRRQQEALESARLQALNRQIAQNEERWKLALEGAGDGVWDWDLDSRELVVSARTHAMLGYALGSVGTQGEDWGALMHAQDRERLDQAIKAHLAGPSESLRVEVRIRRADGDWGWFQVRGTRVESVDAQGTWRRLTGTITDVTERQRAEAALRESEARAHDTFEHAAVGMLHQTPQGRIERVNNKLCELLGLPREALLALSLEGLTHADDALLGPKETEQLVSGELDSLVREGRLRHSQGSYLWVRMTCSLANRGNRGSKDSNDIHDSAANTAAPTLICVVEDVHRRTIFERDRHELLLRYRDVANELSRHRLALDKHTMVWLFDPTGVVLYVNSRLCEVSGYCSEELLGAVRAFPSQGAIADCWLGRNPTQVLSSLREDVMAGKVWQGELLHSKKDGDPYWAATTVVPIVNADGALQEVYVLQTDITRRVHAERETTEARNLELRIGANIQQSLLATVLDQRLPRTWLSAFTRPSQGIDGDFLHVITVGSDCVDVVAADVMGKGIGAALIGASAKMQLGQSLAQLMADAPDRGRPEPATVLQALHKAMVPSLRELEAFITICYLRIDSAANTITWVGCGHEEPLLVRSDGSSQVLPNRHPPMGVLDVVDYEQDTTHMHEGDALFSCSDGLSDAIKPDGSRVGRPAVEAAVRRRLQHCRAPGAIVHALQQELAGPGVRAVDDTSLLLAVRTADTTRASRRELPYNVDALVHVRGVVGHRCSMAGLDEDRSALFVLACVEAYTNIVRHNTGRVGDSKVELLVLLEPEQIKVEFVYVADAVHALQLPAEKLPAERLQALDAYPEGGFGLTIMRAATDGLFHEHLDGINTTRLVKYLRH